jgi:chloramphenicol-sensitive protein RarD
VSSSPDRKAASGAVAAGAAYLIWGAFPLYFRALAAVTPAEVLAHRIAWSALFMAALVTVLRRWPSVLSQLRAPGVLLSLAASALLISSNWLVYIWAVQSGHVLDASLGYFINPLVSVLLGVLFLREPLSMAQRVAVTLAAVGVLALVLRAGHLPWVALTLAGSFAFYGLLRKRLAVDAVAGLLAEVTLLLPLALGWLGWLAARGESRFFHTPTVTALLAVSGVVTAVPLLLFGIGVRRIRLATVGLLQYLNPTAQFAQAVLLFGEPFAAAQALAFGCIWASLAVYSVDALRPRRPVERPP